MLHILFPVAISALFGFWLLPSNHCSCSAINPYIQDYLSYYGIASAIMWGCIALLHAFGVRRVVPYVGTLIISVTQLIWSILTLRYTHALKTCKCESVLHADINVFFSVNDLICFALLVFMGGYLFFKNI